MADTFETFIEKERERLSKKREGAMTKLQEAENEIAEVERELAAIGAYEAAKAGKLPAARRGRTSGVRAARGSRQGAVLDLLSKSTSGMTRGEILEAMGLKGDKSGEQSVSNALNNLKKAKKVSSKDGRYQAAA
jgi:hypothetical protein